MKIEVINKETNEQICIADVLFGLDSLVVLECDRLSKNALEQLLLSSASLKNYSYDHDDIILHKLRLYDRKYQFGRMSEAYILYAVLNNFNNTNTIYQVYPLKDEIISMIDVDIRYSNIYLWKMRRRPYLKDKANEEKPCPKGKENEGRATDVINARG